MTKDNACGAGVELPKLPPHDEVRPYITGTRGNPDLYAAHQVRLLLVESQAHNAKLEAQAERMRAALTALRRGHDSLNHRLTVAQLLVIDGALKP